MTNEVETFYLIEVPGGDRRYICHNITPERYKQLKAEKEGTRIFKVLVRIPLPEGKSCDFTTTGKAVEVFVNDWKTT